MQLLAIKPNLGCPAFAKLESDGAVFRAAFASSLSLDHGSLNVAELLQGKLFLQRLRDAKSSVGRFVVAEWPESITAALFPVEVLSVDGLVSTSANYFWYETGPQGVLVFQAQSQYEVTLRALPTSRSGASLKVGLCNLVQIDDSEPAGRSRITYHSVYLHTRRWREFSFYHITDTHISERNEWLGQSLLEYKFSNWRFNFNAQFRHFISNANAAHRMGHVDFIVLTGDLVDYVQARHYIDNFELFFRTLIGLEGTPELEVPLFTCLGNHDYRLYEYPLDGHVDLTAKPFFFFGPQYSVYTIKQITEYERFGISQEVARKLDPGDGVYTPADAAHFIRSCDTPRPSYCGLVSAERDYILTLGQCKIVCLDSGPDFGAPNIAEYVAGQIYGFDESQSNFVAGSPDSSGFSDGQIALVRKAVQDTEDLVILAFHAPVLNTKLPQCSSHEGKREPEYSYGVAQNNFESFVAAMYRREGGEPRKGVDLILTGHTHYWRQYGFEPGSTLGSYRICSDIFTDDLADAPDKEAWWKGQPPLLVQTPSLCTDAVNPKPFDLLRVEVYRSVIASIQKLTISQKIAGPPRIVERVLVIRVSPDYFRDHPLVFTEGFGRVRGCPSFPVYDAVWERMGADVRALRVNADVPISSSHAGVIFVRIGPCGDLDKGIDMGHSLPVRFFGETAKGSVEVQLNHGGFGLADDEKYGRYYYGSFELPQGHSEATYDLRMEFIGVGLDSKPETVSSLQSSPPDAGQVDMPVEEIFSSSFSNYEPGPDLHHRIKVGPAIVPDGLGNNDPEQPFICHLGDENADWQHIPATLIRDGEIDFFKLSWDLRAAGSAYVRPVISLACQGEADLEISVLSSDGQPVGKLAAASPIESFPVEKFSDNAAIIKVTDPICRCRGPVQYTLSARVGAILLDVPVQGDKYWHLKKVPEQWSTRVLEDRVVYSDPRLLIANVKEAASDLTQSLQGASRSDRAVAARTLRDVERYAKQIGRLDEAAEIRNAAARVVRKP